MPELEPPARSAPPTVAIIGAGNVGAGLAATFARAGAAVTLGVRRPQPVRAKFAPAGIDVATPAEAIVAAELVFLAVPGKVAVDVAREHATALAGKVLVDCNNPVGRVDGGVAWTPPAEGSLAAAIAAQAPRVEVVKGFNGFGAEHHADPGANGRPAVVLLAGDGPGKARVAALAAAAGFEPIDAGPLRNAALLESMAVLWIHLAVGGGPREGLGRSWSFGIDASGD